MTMFGWGMRFRGVGSGCFCSGLGTWGRGLSRAAARLGLAGALAGGVCVLAGEADGSAGIAALRSFSLGRTVQNLDLPFDLNGFIEARGGRRLHDDPYEHPTSIRETRLQLELEGDAGPFDWKLTNDFLYDGNYNPKTIHLEDGLGWIDLREANVSFSPADFMDVKVGRQILTWGTGDMIFINDLFPKDWNSFFIGRDEEYLKAPSDAVKLSFFSDLANLNLVLTPRFDSDRYVDNKRLSYWNPMLGRRFGNDLPMNVDKPDRWINDGEIAMRLYRMIGATEVALYGYRGYWKNPLGFDPAHGRATFPDLNVGGASVRGNILGGIGNIELGYYDSRNDRSGDDPFVPNSQVRFLVGYERELAPDFTGAVQYYVEYMMDHGNYVRALPPGAHAKDEDRHVITVRLTRLLMQQNLELSLFVYYSPTDQDGYVRPRVHYKVNDFWAVEAGGNLFFGDAAYTFFNQFNKDSNVYVAVRYAF